MGRQGRGRLAGKNLLHHAHMTGLHNKDGEEEGRKILQKRRREKREERQ